MRLLLYHLILGAGIAMAAGTQFYPYAEPIYRQVMLLVGGIFLLTFGLQVLLFRRGADETLQLAYMFVPDVVLIGLLVFSTGGIDSPFAFLLGLLVIAAGAFGQAILVIVLGLLACIVYLAAVYLQAWIEAVEPSQQDVSHLLLQVCALLLVGIVMSVIARRQARLREAEREAVQAHRKLSDLHSRVMSAMHEGIIVLDERLHPTDMNDAVRTLLGEQVHDDHRIVERLCAVADVRAFLQAPESMKYQQECEIGGRSILLTVSRLPGDDPQARWLFTLVDVTPIRDLERRLAEQSKMAALGHMSAMLAHEIRNPIQALSQGLELLDRVSEERRREIQGILQSEVKRLNRLVGGMLDFSRPMNPRPAPQNMHAFFHSVIHALPAEFRARVRLQCAIDQLVVDGNHFRSVVDNLLSNALKQSEEPVDVALRDDGGRWRLRVCDHGGGIPEKIRARIFEPFVSGRADGIGLGLATVRQICKANGWEISIEDTATGTCFEVCGAMQNGEAHG